LVTGNSTLKGVWNFRDYVGDLMPQQNAIILYCSIPLKLEFDHQIKSGPVRGFLYLHSLPGERDFNTQADLVRDVKEKKALRKLGISASTWRRWLSELKGRGWISVENKGFKSNRITLHGRRRRGR